ncbi:16475_t:CDS:1, partial [Cetraspora pellucida]
SGIKKEKEELVGKELAEAERDVTNIGEHCQNEIKDEKKVLRRPFKIVEKKFEPDEDKTDDGINDNDDMI